MKYFFASIFPLALSVACSSQSAWVAPDDAGSTCVLEGWEQAEKSDENFGGIVVTGNEVYFSGRLPITTADATSSCNVYVVSETHGCAASEGLSTPDEARYADACAQYSLEWAPPNAPIDCTGKIICALAVSSDCGAPSYCKSNSDGYIDIHLHEDMLDAEPLTLLYQCTTNVCD